MPDKSEQSRQLLLRAFTHPESLVQLELHEWELLVRCLRRSKLLASFGAKNAISSDSVTLPTKVTETIQGFQQLIDYRKKLVMWELNRLNKVLAKLDVDVVVLKGGAYILLALPMSKGRLLADIDILVAKKDLMRVEQHLLAHGWQGAAMDDYDQHYYRTWMHEIPPLRHCDRLVEVDIHHTIAPLTSRLHPDPDCLLNAAVKIDNSVCKVLSPCDMVLHSMVHLFHGGELNAGDFRDLVDLHELLSFYSSQDEKFWDELQNRAEELGLQRPLYYALYFCKYLLDTSVPQYLLLNNKSRPSFIVRSLMTYLVPLAILQEHPDYPDRKVAIARWLLYVRSHYLRMPLRLLIPHLLIKSKKRLEPVSH